MSAWPWLSLTVHVFQRHNKSTYLPSLEYLCFDLWKEFLYSYTRSDTSQ